MPELTGREIEAFAAFCRDGLLGGGGVGRSRTVCEAALDAVTDWSDDTSLVRFGEAVECAFTEADVCSGLFVRVGEQPVNRWVQPFGRSAGSLESAVRIAARCNVPACFPTALCGDQTVSLQCGIAVFTYCIEGDRLVLVKACASAYTRPCDGPLTG